MRIYISADIEGIAGVTNLAQLNSLGFEYGLARQWMTREVVAAAEACHNAGATEVVVADGHGNGQNLLLDELPDYVRTVRSWPRPLLQMEGIQHGSFAAALLVGHHAQATAAGGLLAHTMHWGCMADVRLNGVSQSETMMCALLAAEFGVPTIFCSGDDVYVDHAREFLGDIECVITKRSLGYTSVDTVKPSVSCGLVRAGVARALARLPAASVPTLPDSYTLEVEFKHRLQAELWAYLPWVRRSGPAAFAVDLRSMQEVTKVLGFVSFYQPVGLPAFN